MRNLVLLFRRHFGISARIKYPIQTPLDTVRTVRYSLSSFLQKWQDWHLNHVNKKDFFTTNSLAHQDQKSTQMYITLPPSYFQTIMPDASHKVRDVWPRKAFQGLITAVSSVIQGPQRALLLSDISPKQPLLSSPESRELEIYYIDQFRKTPKEEGQRGHTI